MATAVSPANSHADCHDSTCQRVPAIQVDGTPAPLDASRQCKDLPAGFTTVLLSGAIHFWKPPSSGDVGSTPGLPGIRLGISFFTCRHECTQKVCSLHPVLSLQVLAGSKQGVVHCQSA